MQELTIEQKAKILGKIPQPPLYYKFGDYEYNTNSKERVLSGIARLDELTKGFEMGCITIWTGLTNCLDKDTEYFNGEQWKKLDEYALGERVLQYNEDGTATLEYPERYIKQPCSKMYSFQSKAIDMVATGNHDMVYVTSKGNINKKQIKDVIKMHNSSKHGFNGKIITSFNYSGKGIDLTDEQIRVMVMTICDGSFKNSHTRLCCVNIKKERKIHRAKKILEDAKIEYKEYKNKEGYTRFYYKAPIPVKEFPKEWYQGTNEQLKLITEECIYWDGTLRKSGYSFSSNVKKNADFIQFAVSSTGYRANIETYDRIGFGKGKYKKKNLEYTVNFSKRANTLVGFLNPREKKQFEEYTTKDGYCYCFTMPSGMLVVRRNDKIMITGNSGKTTTMTMITKQTIAQGEKVFYFNGEQTKDDFKNNLYKQSSTLDKIVAKRYKTTKIVDYFVNEEEAKRLNKIYEDKLFVYNNNMLRTIDFLLQAMEDVNKKYGVRVFMLDNFMQIDTRTNDEYREQKDIMEKLRTFAVNKNVHIHLVAHPRKGDKFQTRLTIYDVLGSSNLVNKAYNVISIIRTDSINEDDAEFKRLEKLMQREGYDILKSNSILEILKTKGERCGVIGLKYDTITRTYKELEKTITEEDYKKAEREMNAGAECPF